MKAHHAVALTGVLVALPAQQALSTTFGPAPGGLTGDRVAVGRDMDGDGVPDLLVSSPGIGQGVIHVVSGATNSIRQLNAPAGSSTFPYSVMLGVPDMNLDGRGDIVVDWNGTLRAYSGATLALLWSTPTSYGPVAPVGDRNGDGRGDLAAIALVSPPELRVLSGGGPILAQFPLVNGGGAAMIAIGDVTGDGVTELARALSNSIEVLQLSNPPLLLTIPFDAWQLSAANFSGDARNEIVAGGYSSNIVRVFSANTGAVVRSWNGVEHGVFGVIGDLNADAVPELALRGHFGGTDVFLVSGANGGELARWPETSQFRCEIMAGGVDMNGDGFGDLLLGSTAANVSGFGSNATGGWQRLSGRILATMSSHPTACAQGPFFPLLGLTRPIFGQVATVAGINAPTGTVGFLAFSLQPAIPTNLGIAGCDAWLDLNGISLLQATTTTSWQFALQVPPIPQLAGVRIALQAFYAPTFSAIGLDLTNGIWATLGY